MLPRFIPLSCYMESSFYCNGAFVMVSIMFFVAGMVFLIGETFKHYSFLKISEAIQAISIILLMLPYFVFAIDQLGPSKARDILVLGRTPEACTAGIPVVPWGDTTYQSHICLSLIDACGLSSNPSINDACFNFRGQCENIQDLLLKDNCNLGVDYTEVRRVPNFAMDSQAITNIEGCEILQDGQNKSICRYRFLVKDNPDVCNAIPSNENISKKDCLSMYYKLNNYDDPVWGGSICYYTQKKWNQPADCGPLIGKEHDVCRTTVQYCTGTRYEDHPEREAAINSCNVIKSPILKQYCTSIADNTVNQFFK